VSFAGDTVPATTIESIIGIDSHRNITGATMEKYIGTKVHENMSKFLDFLII
jgi:hypothetical protein